jgi:hypothetical protein
MMQLMMLLELRIKLTEDLKAALMAELVVK